MWKQVQQSRWLAYPLKVTMLVSEPVVGILRKSMLTPLMSHLLPCPICPVLCMTLIPSVGFSGSRTSGTAVSVSLPAFSQLHEGLFEVPSMSHKSPFCFNLKFSEVLRNHRYWLWFSNSLEPSGMILKVRKEDPQQSIRFQLQELARIRASSFTKHIRPSLIIICKLKGMLIFTAAEPACPLPYTQLQCVYIKLIIVLWTMSQSLSCLVTESHPHEPKIPMLLYLQYNNHPIIFGFQEIWMASDKSVERWWPCLCCIWPHINLEPHHEAHVQRKQMQYWNYIQCVKILFVNRYAGINKSKIPFWTSFWLICHGPLSIFTE